MLKSMLNAQRNKEGSFGEILKKEPITFKELGDQLVILRLLLPVMKKKEKKVIDRKKIYTS